MLEAFEPTRTNTYPPNEGYKHATARSRLLSPTNMARSGIAEPAWALSPRDKGKALGSAMGSGKANKGKRKT